MNNHRKMIITREYILHKGSYLQVLYGWWDIEQRVDALVRQEESDEELLAR